jgi:adenylylsulfate kinase-like enzyme
MMQKQSKGYLKLKNKQSQGNILWITGLSGAGKSTIALKIRELLAEKNITPVILDGDAVREAIADPYWLYDNASRLAGSYRYARLANMLASQGHIVIVPTISMFHEVQKWNRENSNNYLEVYLKCDEKVRKKRDPKKLYQQHKIGKTEPMSGIDINVEEPLTPDLLINNNGTEETISQIALQILQASNIRW